MRQRMKNQLASGGTVGEVLEFILEASEAVTKSNTVPTSLFDII